MKSIRYLLSLAVAMLMSLGNLAHAMLSAPRLPRVRLANTYDAALATHEAAVNRTNDAAISARHLLWKKGASDGTVALNGASDVPLGTIDNVEAGTATNQSVLLLGRGPTKKMVAAGDIAAGAAVYAAANGKVDDVGTIYLGVALTAAAVDNDVLEVNDCVPVDVSGT